MVENQRTLREIQQDFANNCGFERRIIWDLFSSGQADLFREKIRHLIPLPPNAEESSGKIRAAEERRRILFESVWAQRKYSNGNSLTTLIYVLVTKESDFNKAPETTEFSCHPVFRARKCRNSDGDCERCCMVFIDEIGRVYQHWDDFVQNNTLPEGTMVAPRRGIYMFDSIGRVELDIYATPASTIMAKALSVFDTTSAIGGVLSAGISIATIATLPVSGPLLSFAAGVGFLSAGYATARSTGTIVDRANHEQSISLSDRQGRNSWIGVAAGAVGLGATGATRALQAAASTGRNISLITEVVVNGMNISSVVLSGTGVANGVLDLALRYRDDENCSKLEIVQLSASLFLFTHSLYNFRLASNIVSETQNGTIDAYRRGLSNRQRRMFNKMTKETIRMQGEARGKMDIIRNVNEIPSKQYLNDIFKINKQLNEKMIRPSFGGGGNGNEPIVLNGQVAVNSQELRASVQHGQGPDILGKVTSSIPPTSNQFGGKIVGSSGGGGGTPLNNAANLNEETILETTSNPLAAGVHALIQSSIFLTSGIEIKLIEFGSEIFNRIANAESFENVLSVLARYFNDNADGLRYIIRLTRRFVEHKLSVIENVLKIFISTESVLYRIGLIVTERYGQQSVDFLISLEDEIFEAVREWLLNLNPNDSANQPIKCQYCQNEYTVTTLE